MTFGAFAIALFVLAGAVELFLLVARDVLVARYRRDALESKVRQRYQVLQQTNKLIAEGREDVRQALKQVDEIRKREEEIEEEQAERRADVQPVFVHVLGEPKRGGSRFRAALSKELPRKADESQRVLWEMPNFVDVWTDDPRTAADLAERQFPPRTGYSTGAFQPVGEPVEA